MPDHPAFGGLLLEIDSTEVIDNLDLVINVARRVRLHNIAISIDNVGAEWPALMGLQYFPFVELKVDHQFVSDARYRLKRASVVARRRARPGARVVAQGVEPAPISSRPASASTGAGLSVRQTDGRQNSPARACCRQQASGELT